MCGLIFCADPMMWPSLVAANLERAGRNKGALTFTAWRDGLTLEETIDTQRVVEAGSDYDFGKPGIVHLQAPTSSYSLPHPATAHGVLVWHNGLFQPSAIEAMQKATTCGSGWDTELIAAAVAHGFDSAPFLELGMIAGSFAVIAWKSGRLWAFRNSIAPLFRLPCGSTLSSVATTLVSEPLRPGVVYVLDDGQGVWTDTGWTFPVAHNPYGI